MRKAIRRLAGFLLCAVLLLEDNAIYGFCVEIGDTPDEPVIETETELSDETVNTVSGGEIEIDDKEDFVAEIFDEASYALKYTVDAENNATITGYEGTISDGLVIPETIDGYTVTAIGGFAFQSDDNIVGALTLPNTLKTIGELAFYCCSNINGFLVIPDSVETIDSEAFYECEGFSGVDLGNGVKSIGEYAFAYCSNLTGDCTIPYSVEYAGEGAFSYWEGVDTLTISNGAKGINRDIIIYNTGVTKVVNNSTVGGILLPDETGYHWEDASTHEEARILSAGQTTVKVENTEYEYEYSPTLNLKYRVLSDGSVEITGYDGDIEANSNLELPSVIDGKTVSSIGYYAFYGSSVNGTLKLPDNLKTIWNYAFGVSHITGDLTIPDSVEIIGELAFCECFMLEGNLYLGSSLKEIGGSAFDECIFDGDLIIPDSVELIGDYAFGECFGFDGRLLLGSGVKQIGYMAFGKCKNLTGEITIPAGVTAIDPFAFSNCYGISKIVNNSSVGGIILPAKNGDCWEDADSSEVITTVSAGQTAIRHSKLIGTLDYIYSDSLTLKFTSDGADGAKLIGYSGEFPEASEIGLPDTVEGFAVTIIGDSAFENCDGNGSKIIIPDSVETIGESAFAFGKDCELVLGSGIKTIGESAFDTCEGIKGNLVIPDSVETIGEYAFYECTGLCGVVLGTGVKTIGAGAFASCYNLTGDVVIPDSVEYISEWVFSETGVKTFTIGSGVKKIDHYAFYHTIGTERIINNSMVGGIGLPSEKGYHWVDSTTNDETLQLSAGQTVISVANTEYEYEYRATLKLLYRILDDGSVEITGYDGNPEAEENSNPILPTEIDGKAVTSIGVEAFKESKLTGTLTLPGNLKRVCDRAFQLCGDSLTGDLIIPDSVEAIDADAFRACYGLSGELKLGSGLKTIGPDAFYWSCFTGGLVIPDSVEIIEEFAFGSAGFDGELKLGSGLKKIGKRAFTGYKGATASLVIPAGVEEIAEDAFDFCKEIKEIVNKSSVSGIILPKNNGYFWIDSVSSEIITTVSAGQTAIRRVELTGTLDYIYSDSLTLKFTSDGAGGAKLTGYSGVLSQNPNIVLPSEVEGYTVTEIGSYAFMSSDITGTLTLPNKVKKIDFRAFYSCGALTGDLIIPDSVATIDEDAFFNCTGFMGNLKLGTGLKCIEQNAFNGCSNLTGSLVIPDNVISIGNYAFEGCNKFTGDLMIPDSVTTIGKYAFNSCQGITGTLTIGAGLTDIDEYPFGSLNVTHVINNSSLDNIKLPEHYNMKWVNDETKEYVTTISSGETATLYDMNGQFYDYSGSFKLKYVLDGQGGIKITGYKGTLGAGETLNIPDTINGMPVVEIGDYAFSQAYDLTGTLTIPGTVKKIGEGAFLRCYGFTGGLTIPDSVETIGELAFKMCDGFDGELKLGSGLTSIGAGAFDACQHFSGNLIIPAGITSIGAHVFNECFSFTGDLVIPDTVTEIGDYAFSKCRGFDGGLKLGSRVETIGMCAFDTCEKLSGELVIPASVTSIGDSAFYGCEGFMGDLVIPNTVTELGIYAFYHCIGFDGELSIGSGLTTINQCTFAGCNQLSGFINIPDNIVKIDISAFGSCIGFTGVESLGSNVKEIGAGAFEACTGLTGELIIPDSVETIGNNAFYREYNLTSFSLGKNVSYIGNRAFCACENVTGNLIIPDSVTYIGDEAFWIDDKITGALILGNNVKHIGQRAFYNISGTVVLSENLEEVGEEAFKHCVNVTRIVNNSNIDGLKLYSHVNFEWINELTGEVVTEVSAGEAVARRTVESSIYDYSDTFKLIYYSGTDKAFIEGYYGFLPDGVDLVLPSTLDEKPVTVIHPGAFANAQFNIGSITLPDSLEEIGDYAFDRCSGIHGNLAIPDTVTSIGLYAFAGCSGLEGTLTIPASVTEIGANAFSECTGLKKVVNLSIVGEIGLPVIQGYHWQDLDTGRATDVLNSSTSVALVEDGRNEYYYSDTLTMYYDFTEDGYVIITGYSGYLPEGETLTVPDHIYGATVSEVASGAFKGCKSINGLLTLPNYLNSIGDYAFEDSLFAGEVIIPSNVIAVGSNPFKGCYLIDRIANYSLIDVELPIAEGSYWENETLIEDNITSVPGGSIAVRHLNNGCLIYDGVEREGYSYTGKAISPKITVLGENRVYVEKTDYTVSYKNNTKVYTLKEGETGFNAKKAPSITVTFKGNYSGKYTIYFTINPKNVSDSDMVYDDIAPVIESSKSVKPVPSVKNGSKKLANKTDFTVSYFSDEECTTQVTPKTAGTYYIKLTGKGNYTGEKVMKFTICPKTKKLVSKLTVSNVSSQTYTGFAIEPRLKVKDGKVTLTHNVDYMVTYSNNTEVGTATATIKGIGNKYVGTKAVTFKITGTSISKYKVSGTVSQVYDGTEKKQDGATLTKGTVSVNWIEKSVYDTLDSESQKGYGAVVSYSKNVNAGTATMKFTGVNKYTGTVKKTFKIGTYDLKTNPDGLATITLNTSSYGYSRAGVKPEPSVYFNSIPLEKGKDYTLSYSNNNVLSGNPKKVPTVKVTGKGNFKGNVSLNFEITGKSFTSYGISVTMPDKTYSKKAGNWKPQVTVYDDGKKLSAGKDYVKAIEYTYSYIPGSLKVLDGSLKSMPEIERHVGDVVGSKDVVPAGTRITAQITAAGSYYSGNLTASFYVVAQDINKLKIKVSDKEYTGDIVEIHPEDITFTGNNQGEVTFDIITPPDAINVGKGTFVIQGTGNYGGTRKVTFKIKAKPILSWLKWW